MVARLCWQQLQQGLSDDEVAKVALFLVSNYSTAMTGAIIDANGGEFIAV